MSRTVKAIIIAVAAVLTFVVASAASSNASTASFSFTTDPNVGISGPPDSLYHVGHLTTPTEMVGQNCSVIIDVANNDSVRGGTDLVVGSGGQALELLDTEAVKGNAPPQTIGTLVLGQSVNAWVRFGPAGVASVDAAIHVSCDDVIECLIPEGCDPPVTVGPPLDPAVRPPTAAVAVVSVPQVTG